MALKWCETAFEGLIESSRARDDSIVGQPGAEDERFKVANAASQSSRAARREGIPCHEEGAALAELSRTRRSDAVTDKCSRRSAKDGLGGGSPRSLAASTSKQ
jgi:hypothetical protein